MFITIDGTFVSLLVWLFPQLQLCSAEPPRGILLGYKVRSLHKPFGRGQNTTGEGSERVGQNRDGRWENRVRRVAAARKKSLEP